MSNLKIFFDLLSQPARSVLMFARTNKVPFTPCPIATMKLEHRTDEYAAINPFKRVPAMQDGDFNLTESMAITKYLHQKFDCPDHWYPASLQKRARVNEYLDWHHSDTRPPVTDLFISDVVHQMITKTAPDPATVEDGIKKVDKTLDGILSYFLRDRQFLCGDDITIADIFGANEVIMVDHLTCHSLDKKPELKEWIERVRQRVDPEIFDDVCKALYRFKKGKK